MLFGFRDAQLYETMASPLKDDDFKIDAFYAPMFETDIDINPDSKRIYRYQQYKTNSLPLRTWYTLSQFESPQLDDSPDIFYEQSNNQYKSKKTMVYMYSPPVDDHIERSKDIIEKKKEKKLLQDITLSKCIFEKDDLIGLWDQPSSLRAQLLRACKFVNVSPLNILDLKSITETVLPVSYNDDLYKDMMESGYKTSILVYLPKEAYENFSLRLYRGRQLENSSSLSSSVYADYKLIASCGTRMHIKSYNSSTGEYSLNCCILSLGVLLKFQNLGIGAVLIEKIENVCRKRGNVEELFLQVQVSNIKAIQFYQKMGFVIVEKIMNYYEENIIPPHCFVMVKPLPPSPFYQDPYSFI